LGRERDGQLPRAARDRARRPSPRRGRRDVDGDERGARRPRDSAIARPDSPSAASRSPVPSSASIDSSPGLHLAQRRPGACVRHLVQRAAPASSRRQVLPPRRPDLAAAPKSTSGGGRAGGAPPRTRRRRCCPCTPRGAATAARRAGLALDAPPPARTAGACGGFICASRRHAALDRCGRSASAHLGRRVEARAASRGGTYAACYALPQPTDHDEDHRGEGPAVSRRNGR
jgi:hypothetical protein